MKHTFATTVAIGALLLVAACHSHGTRKYTSVGSTGPQGEAGPQGEQGEQGPSGERGPQGVQGADGSPGASGADGKDGNFGLGDAGLIATGGLVGDNGVGGTGLLANTSDPSTSLPVVSEASMNTGTLLSTTGDRLSDTLSANGQDTPVTGLAVATADTISAAGGALTASGSGETPLVDAALASTSPLLSTTVGGAVPLGDSGESTSLIGVAALSPGEANGSLIEAGAVSGGTLVDVDLAPGSDGGVDIPGVASLDVTGATGDLLNESPLDTGSLGLEDEVEDNNLINGLLSGLGGGS